MKINILIFKIFCAIFFSVLDVAVATEEATLLYDHTEAYDHLLIFSDESDTGKKSDKALFFSSETKKVVVHDLNKNIAISEFIASEISDWISIKKVIIDDGHKFIYLLGASKNKKIVRFYRINIASQEVKSLDYSGAETEYHNGMDMKLLSLNVLRVNNPITGIMFDIDISDFDCEYECAQIFPSSEISLPLTVGSIQSLPSNNIFLLAGNKKADIYGFNFDREGIELLTSLGLKKEMQPLFLDLEKGEAYPLLVIGNPLESEVIVYKYNKDYRALDFISKIKTPRSKNNVGGSRYIIAGSDNLSRFLVYDHGKGKLLTFSFIENTINLLSSEDKKILEMDVTGDGKSYVAILESGDIYMYPLSNMETGFSQEKKIFGDKFETAGIISFDIEEFIRPVELSGKCDARNYFPPRRSWCNAIEAAKVMSEFRKRLNDKFGKDARAFIKGVNNSCFDNQMLPYNDFLSIVFDSNKGEVGDWINLLKEMQQENWFSGDVKEEDGKVRLIINDKNLWVYVGEKNSKGTFESKYFKIHDPNIKGDDVIPINRMTLRAGSPKQINDKWIFAERTSVLAQHHSFHVEELETIPGDEANSIRYWAGGSVSSKNNKNDWLVIVRSSPEIEDIKGALEVLRKEYSDFPLEVYKDPNGKYAIVIGENLSQSDAKSLVLEAKCAGMSDDTYMWIPINWQKMNNFD